MPFFFVIVLIVIVVVTAAVGQGNNGLALISVWIFFPAAIALYFSPSIVAATRSHPNRMPISLLNLFLGWTVIGWVGALIWAYSSTQSPATGAASTNLNVGDIRKCPYCAEDVRRSAIKCRHCGSDLDPISAQA